MGLCVKERLNVLRGNVMNKVIAFLSLVAVVGCGQQGTSRTGPSGESDYAAQSSTASPSSSGTPDPAELQRQLEQFAQQTLEASNRFKRHAFPSSPIVGIEKTNSLIHPYNGNVQWDYGPKPGADQNDVIARMSGTLRRRFLYEAASQKWRIGVWFDDGTEEGAFTVGSLGDF